MKTYSPQVSSTHPQNILQVPTHTHQWPRNHERRSAYKVPRKTPETPRLCPDLLRVSLGNTQNPPLDPETEGISRFWKAWGTLSAIWRAQDETEPRHRAEVGTQHLPGSDLLCVPLPDLGRGDPPGPPLQLRQGNISSFFVCSVFKANMILGLQRRHYWKNVWMRHDTQAAPALSQTFAGWVTHLHLLLPLPLRANEWGKRTPHQIPGNWNEWPSQQLKKGAQKGSPPARAVAGRRENKRYWERRGREILGGERGGENHLNSTMPS